MTPTLAIAVFALTVLSGDWKVADGALRGEAPAEGAGKRPAVAAALVGPEEGPRAESIEATVTAEPPEQGRPANAFILFDVTRDAAGRIAGARFAGLFVGGRRAAIGTIARNQRAKVDVDASCDVRPGQAYKLKVAIAADRATLLVDGSEVLSAPLDGGRTGSGQGFYTLGAARFDDVAVRAGGALAYEEKFDGYTDGALPSGESMTGPASPSPAPAPAPSPMTDGMTPPGGTMTGPAPTPAPVPTAVEGGGYAGGPLGKTPGLDGPLGAESFALAEDARRLIRRRFLDLLGRGPTEAEILAAAKAGDEASVDALVASGEFWRSWYEEELFYMLLIDQFRPTGEPLASLPDRLARGEADPKGGLAEIVISQYFSARNPGNDTFVTVVLEQGLGLKVQEKANVATLEAGKKMYDGYETAFLGEKGASQSDVVRIVFGKRAFAERYVERLHRRICGAELPEAERAAAAERFEKDPRGLAAVVRGWVLSPRYVSTAKYPRAKTDPQWVRTLYADLLGARPAYKEFRDTRNALLALADSTPIRRVLGKVVVDSKRADRAAAVGGDGKRWIEERFLLLLGRKPRAGELEAYEAVLKESGPRVVLRAIVQSQEYQSY